MKKTITTTLLALSLFCNSSIIKGQAVYYKDVAPIIFNKCSPCHNPDNIGPISFLNYSGILSDTAAMHSAISSGEMPPWPPDTTYTKFIHQDERRLTSTEYNTILQWIKTGAQPGATLADTSQAPTCPTFPVSNKLKGKADLVVGLGEVKSNSGVGGAPTNPYNCFVIPTGLTEDRWIRAVEFVPGNRKVVHHCVITVDTTGTKTSDVSGNCTNQLGQFGIGGWSAGASPVVYPNKLPLKVGQRIPKGSSICMQMHFAPGSGGMIDSSKVRIYFYDKDSLTGIRPVHDDVVLQYWGLSLGGGNNPSNIAANTAVWITADPGSFAPGGALPNPQANNTDMSIISCNPHSHFVCTKIKNYAYSGTDTIPLISIPNWRYQWQGYYYYPKPIKVPSTHTLESKHYYDNTSDNGNLLTDPSNAVTFGTATTDEMLFDDFVWMNYRTGDENIDLAAIAAADTLFAINGSTTAAPYEQVITVKNGLTGIEPVNAIVGSVSVNPNPADNKLNIVTGQTSDYETSLFNITGQKVLQSVLFNSATVIDLSGISNGLYILEIVNTNTGEKTAKKIIINH